MDEKRSKKMWSAALTTKTYRYYAITQFINQEKTWNAYFKAMKCLDGLAACISSKKFDDKNLRRIVSLGNEIVESFSKEATTRMIFAIVSNEVFSEAKTLLEWLRLYWNKPIPEADLEDIPWSIKLADRVKEFNKKKKD